MKFKLCECKSHQENVTFTLVATIELHALAFRRYLGLRYRLKREMKKSSEWRHSLELLRFCWLCHCGAFESCSHVCYSMLT